MELNPRDLVEHILQIERTQARMEGKLDQVSEELRKLCEQTDRHAITLERQEVRLSALVARTSQLETMSLNHQSALDKAAGARLLLNGLVAMLGAATALLAQYLFK